MEVVKVSSKYQISIPKRLREDFDVKPGMKFWILGDGDIMRLIPQRDIREFFGTLKTTDTIIERDEEDRL